MKLDKIPVGYIPLTLTDAGTIQTIAPVSWTGTDAKVFSPGKGQSFTTKTREELEEELGIKFPCKHSSLPKSLQEEFEITSDVLILEHSRHFPSRFEVRDYREWIKLGQKFIFPIRMEFDTATIWFKSVVLPEDLVKAIQNEKAHLLIEFPWESRNISRWMFDLLDEFCERYSLPRSSVTLSISQAGDVNYLGPERKFQIRHTQYFREISWHFGKQPVTYDTVQQEAYNTFHSYLNTTGDFKKLFLGEIGRATADRLFLFGLLSTEHSERSYVSFRNHYDSDIKDIRADLLQLKENIRSIAPWYWPISRFLDRYDFTQRLELDLGKGQIWEGWFSLESDRKFRETSFIEIVPETNFFNPENSFITEKTYKPILTAKPFIVFSGYRFLEKFREDGFLTFGDFWDESYDLVEEPHNRMVAIRDLLDSLKKLSVKEMQDMYCRMRPILEHNFKLLLSKKPVEDTMKWLGGLVGDNNNKKTVYKRNLI